MKKLFYIIFFLISIQGIAQNYSEVELKQLDSLNAIIINPKSHDTLLASAYVGLSEILYVSNLDTMNFLCLKTQEIVEKRLARKPMSEQISKSLKLSLAKAINNLGYVYENKGDIPLALKYYHESLRIREEINDKIGIATSFNNIGWIHSTLGDHELATDYTLKSLKIRKEIGDQYGVSNSYNNLGLIIYQKGDVPRALEYFEESLKIRIKIGDKKNAANSYTNIAGVNRKQGNLNKALEYYYKGLEIQEELDDHKGIINSLTGAGQIEVLVGNIEKAKKMGDRALQLSKENGLLNQTRRSAKLLYDIALKQKKWELALEMRNLHIRTNDSLNSERAIKAAATEQAKYEYENQKAIDDAENDKLLAIEQKEKEKQVVITYAASTGLALVGIFLFFVFNRLKVTRKQKGVIEKAHNELEEKNQEIMASITYAKRIQSAILPPAKVVKKYLQESFILYKPKDIVAGDFYWMETINRNELGVMSNEEKDSSLKTQHSQLVLFAAADCTGHGVPGAMVSVVCNNALNRSVREYGLTDPGEILNKTRAIVVQEFEKSDEEVKDGMDIALCSLKLPSREGLGGVLKYAGANNPLWIIRNNELLETSANKQPIGKFDNPLPYTTHTFEIQKGDSIYIFSDGYVDQFGGENLPAGRHGGKKFKAKAFRELLLSIQDKTMEKQRLIIDEAFETWKGDLEQIDDVCIIGVKIC